MDLIPIEMQKRPKEIKPGVVYLAFLPPRMTVRRIREIFNKYGKIDRIFLDPSKNNNQSGYFDGTSNSGPLYNKGRRLTKQYTEGWIEFLDKRKAKQTALMLNGTPIEIQRRRAPYSGMLWNVKYLPGFQWSDLAEVAAYEKAVKDQTLRNESYKIKRETMRYIAATTHKNDKSSPKSLKTNTLQTTALESKQTPYLTPNDTDKKYIIPKHQEAKSTYAENLDKTKPAYDVNLIKSIFT